MFKSISIVMAYFNRRSLLETTLKSIAYSKHAKFEVIVIDDGSNRDNLVMDFPKKFPFPINIKRVSRKAKKWVNPCVAYNMGFRLAQNDVVIIQNPECVHVGDVITYAIEHINKKNHISFPCYAVSANTTNQIIASDCSLETIKTIVEPLSDAPREAERETRWYNHAVHRPNHLYFCAALSNENLRKLNGFDERFAYGLGKDDRELVERMKRMKLKFEIPDPLVDPYVIHLNHLPYYDTTRRKNLPQINQDIYDQFMQETSVQAVYGISNSLHMNDR